MVQRVYRGLMLCLIGVFAVFLSSCQGLSPEGVYQGNYFYSSQGLPHSDAVKIQVQTLAKDEFRVVLEGLIGERIGGFSLRIKNPREISILLPEFQNLEIPLKQTSGVLVFPIQAQLLTKKEVCYFGEGDDSQKIQLCLNSELFQLVVKRQEKVLWSLSGRKFKGEAKLVLEPPRSLLLREALEVAFTQGFDFNLSIQKLLQARHTAHAAWLNLIPSLGTALVWNAEPGYVSAIATAQALTPFLLPSKWLKAKQASRECRATQAAQWIIQANIAAHVEQLAYALDRDLAILKAYSEVANHLSSWTLVSKVRPGERTLSSHEIAEIQKVLDWLSALRQTAERVYKEDQYGLSLALGFKNPEAVERVILEDEPRSVESLSLVNQKSLSAWGLLRSFELEQINHLISAAEQRKKEIYFLWLDPTVDSSYNLGVQLIAQVNLAKAHQLELKMRRDETQARLLQEIYRVSSEWNQSVLQLQKHARTREELKQPSVDLNQWMKERISHGSIDSDSLRSMVQLYLSSELDSVMDWSSFHIAESKRNRILLTGSFERLLPKVEEVLLPQSANATCFGRCVP